MSEPVVTLDISRLADARQRAMNQGVSVMQVLEDVDGYAPEALIQQLGQLLHIAVLDMKAIHMLTPAFDVLPFSEAIMHECALFRHEQRYLLAISNPFSSRIRAWAEERFSVPIAWRLVHPADLAAFFAPFLTI